MFPPCDLSVCYALNDWVFSFPLIIMWLAIWAYGAYEGLVWFASTRVFMAMVVDSNLQGYPVAAKVVSEGRVLEYVLPMGKVSTAGGAADVLQGSKVTQADILDLPIVFRKGIRTTIMFLVSLKRRRTIGLRDQVGSEGEGEEAVRSNEEVVRSAIIKLIQAAGIPLKDQLLMLLMGGLGGGGAVGIVMLLTGFHK